MCMCVCVCESVYWIAVAVHLKLTWRSKSAILQLKNNKNKNEIITYETNLNYYELLKILINNTSASVKSVTFEMKFIIYMLNIIDGKARQMWSWVSVRFCS